ncbi:family 20 glycosylhydrolase [Marinimicrobium sp. ABcell2]|uniref:family 20 glycosylhydrolase n=1 Tax=Marinimicrobium sp. ABcell2 TaxID=3069751 RepID=UPI0027AE5C1C|nr:family 20 glycosylhydrolase [Marinimicrobium sp. ABcell2]MDQ2075918.1 family 20 glycosylhydrolase [Marinimicrobium sp. ABcell2]
MRSLILLTLSLFSLAASAQNLSQQELKTFAEGADLRFAAISNVGAGAPHIKLMLENNTDVQLPSGAGDWAIYFHSVRRITQTEQAGLRLSHLQGDLHRLEPTGDFPGLGEGQEVELSYSASAHMVSYTDFMPRAFIHVPGLEPVIFANTDTENTREFVEPLEREEQLLRSSSDVTPIATAQNRYQAHEAANQVRPNSAQVRERIIPKPLRTQTRWGNTTLDSNWQIRYAGRLTGEAAYLQDRLREILGSELNSEPDHVSIDGPVIRLTVDPEADALPEAPESYTLRFEQNAIVIIGRDNAGAFYGLQSLLNLLPAETEGRYDLPRLSVVDSPRAPWRGMHYDMGRNFHGKEVTLRLIEQMARYKLNKLHLHLTEDEGWRLEIPGLPELTEIGGHRCFDLDERECLLTQLGTGPHTSGSGNGFYSREDFIEILRYAAERHIEVIPEIDMPGHARAAVKTMEARYARLQSQGRETDAWQYRLADPEDSSEYLTVQNYDDNSINVCMESTYAFIDKVMYELQQMYREAGQVLNVFHMGGDEVGKGSWTGSPKCAELIQREAGVAGVADLKPYFVSRVAALASKRGLALAAWEDGLMYDANQPFNRAQFANERVLANPWDNIWEWGAGDRAYRLANAGYEIILSHATHLYFDHPHEAHPEERGYYWATRYTNLEKVFGYMPDHVYANATRTRDGAPIENLEALVGRPMVPLKKPDNVLGMQGQVWTETIRTPEQLEAMLYPRLMSLAERAWHRADWEGSAPDTRARRQDFVNFAHVLVTRELPKLAASGANAHLLPPGGKMEDGILYASTDLPGLTIEVSTDGGQSWWTYREPVTLEAESVHLRARSHTYLSRSTRLK